MDDVTEVRTLKKASSTFTSTAADLTTTGVITGGGALILAADGECKDTAYVVGYEEDLA
jgi:hypothetical protein